MPAQDLFEQRHRPQPRRLQQQRHDLFVENPSLRIRPPPRAAGRLLRG
jgi:hypothetical protein